MDLPIENGTSPVITIMGCVIVAIKDDLDDHSVMVLQDQVVQEIARSKARGVIIDISGLEIVDTFAGRMLGAMASMSHILNARTILAGMRPAVAMTLVELGMTLEGVETALNADRAMTLILEDRAGVRNDGSAAGQIDEADANSVE